MNGSLALRLPGSDLGCVKQSLQKTSSKSTLLQRLNDQEETRESSSAWRRSAILVDSRTLAFTLWLAERRQCESLELHQNTCQLSANLAGRLHRSAVFAGAARLSGSANTSLSCESESCHVMSGSRFQCRAAASSPSTATGGQDYMVLPLLIRQSLASVFLWQQPTLCVPCAGVFARACTSENPFW